MLILDFHLLIYRLEKTSMPPRRPIRRKRIQNNDGSMARWCLALVCLWPLLVILFWGRSSTSNPSSNQLDSNSSSEQNAAQVHNPGFQIRKYLDRVDVMGYGPTHPRVAVVIVGNNSDDVLASVESVFRYVINECFVC